ncbi:MAG TPA: hypothetical protein VGX70_00565 [Gemmataceae bacterium]|jgi:hypothetical protein|nr:hypothetical protein [Gemmataceae bacterium]
MITCDYARRRATKSDLERMIEPLIGYICASDQPKATLKLAFNVLSNEVAQLEKAAREHVANFMLATSQG